MSQAGKRLRATTSTTARKFLGSGWKEHGNHQLTYHCGYNDEDDLYGYRCECAMVMGETWPIGTTAAGHTCMQFSSIIPFNSSIHQSTPSSWTVANLPITLVAPFLSRVLAPVAAKLGVANNARVRAVEQDILDILVFEIGSL